MQNSYKLDIKNTVGMLVQLVYLYLLDNRYLDITFQLLFASEFT